MDSIVKKIQKLLALAGSANEHEAMAAMAKAQEMLAQHDLDMAEVQSHSDEPDEAVTKGKVATGKKAAPKWEGFIFMGLAKANNCEAYRSGGVLCMIGRPHRMEVVRSLFEYLINTVDRESKKALAEAKLDPQAEPNLYGTRSYSWRKWETDFRNGMALRIYRRLEEQTKLNKEQGAGQVSALVVQSQAEIAQREIQEWMEANGLRLRNTRAKKIRGGSGYSAGADAGDRVGLNGQLGGGNTPRNRMLSGR